MALDELKLGALTDALRRHVATWGPGKPRTIGYGELIRLADVKHANNGLGAYLDRIASDCSRKNLPPLDVLVVNQKTKRPGKQISEEEWQDAIERIYRSSSYRS